MLDLERITEEVRMIAIEAGAFLREERRNFHRERVEIKGFHDYVSYVDKESERRLVQKLSELLPGSGFVAEEGSGSLADEEFYWLIDPLDGTTNFIHDNAPYCVSIALRNKEELLVGVVYEVCRDECYWAWKDSKAYCNGKEIYVSQIDKMDEAFIALGFPYAVEKYKTRALALIDNLYGNASGLRLLGAAAAELCYIACGRFEGRIEANLGPWDIAAGTLILMRAGGKVTDFTGGDTFYSGHEVLASNGFMHDALLDVLSLQNQKISMLMKDSSEGDCKKETMFDFVLSWTLRVAADNFPYKDKQPSLHRKCREILSKLIFGLENGNKLKSTDKIVSVDVWKQWNWIDLHANVVLEVDGEKQYHLLVIENKAYTLTHDNQLSRYKELINKVYDADSYLKQFNHRHFILITFLSDEDNNKAYQVLKADCDINEWECVSILKVQQNDELKDTESDIFNEFWLREW